MFDIHNVNDWRRLREVFADSTSWYFCKCDKDFVRMWAQADARRLLAAYAENFLAQNPDVAEYASGYGAEALFNRRRLNDQDTPREVRKRFLTWMIDVKLAQTSERREPKTFNPDELTSWEALRADYTRERDYKHSFYCPTHRPFEVAWHSLNVRQRIEQLASDFFRTPEAQERYARNVYLLPTNVLHSDSILFARRSLAHPYATHYAIRCAFIEWNIQRLNQNTDMKHHDVNFWRDVLADLNNATREKFTLCEVSSDFRELWSSPTSQRIVITWANDFLKEINATRYRTGHYHLFTPLTETSTLNKRCVRRRFILWVIAKLTTKTAP